ncbi:MAG TPA: orotate phosphoribosyltransferase [Thermoplasmatales archaeon]|nr:MAG: orotate phosphoribosyltransferase [Candidatus Asgardarchaeum californiense]HEC72447.1 orotate phosphoribosyltransferase [Thermoplasmatales archaeon]
MDLMGLCSICGKPDAMNTCSLCGRLVCNSCFDHVHRVCNICKTGKR